MRRLKVFFAGFAVMSRRWRGAVEFGLAVWRGGLLLTWRHEQRHIMVWPWRRGRWS